MLLCLLFLSNPCLELKVPGGVVGLAGLHVLPCRGMWWVPPGLGGWHGVRMVMVNGSPAGAGVLVAAMVLKWPLISVSACSENPPSRPKMRSLLCSPPSALAKATLLHQHITRSNTQRGGQGSALAGFVQGFTVE